MKLYHAIRPHVETMFVSDLRGEALKREAEYFLSEEAGNKVDQHTQIEEVTNISEIPKSWDESCFLWNLSEEMSAQEFLLKQNDDKEYQEYLRLKSKFGRHDD